MKNPHIRDTAGVMTVAGRPRPPVTGQGQVFWEDLRPDTVITGPGMTITDAHLVSWAGLTGDTVSLHLDEEYAATTPFGARVAHGPLTLSLALGLLTQTGIFGNVRAWLGVDAVRAVAPVFIGDTITPQAELRSSEASEGSAHGKWTLDYSVDNQDGVTVMMFTCAMLIFKRPAEL